MESAGDCGSDNKEVITMMVTTMITVRKTTMTIMAVVIIRVRRCWLEDRAG